MMSQVGQQFLVFNTSSTEPAITKLFGFMTLSKGWHYGSGESISLDGILRAMLAINELRSFNPRKIDVFPAASGNILVVGYFEAKSCVELYVNVDGTYDAVIEIDGIDTASVEDKSLGEARSFLGSEMWRIKSSFDLSIQNILTPNVGVTPVQHSRTPEQTGGFQSLEQTVLPIPANHFVPTSTNSILWG